MPLQIFREEMCIGTATTAHVAIFDSEPVGIWVPKLLLHHEVVRSVVAQQSTPFQQFKGSVLKGVEGLDKISMVWGDFALYETGLPILRDFYAIPGTIIGMPTPAVVATAIHRLKEMKERVCPEP